MFDIAWSELLLIAVVALIFIGPKELPTVLHSIGRMVTKIRRSADDFRRQFEDSVREAGYGDLHKNIQEFRSLNPANQVKDQIVRAMIQEPTPAPAAPVEVAPSVEAAAAATALAEAPAKDAPIAEAPAQKEAALEPPPVAKPADAASEARAPAPAHAGEFANDRIAPAA
jgi:sec-independent protein translocase protein TatB